MDSTVASPHAGLPFLADLLRPYVRDYESMNHVLDHLATFSELTLLLARFNRHYNDGFSHDALFAYGRRRMEEICRLDDNVTPDFRQAVSNFNWRGLYDAAVRDEWLIRAYQANRPIFINRRSGATRWIINSAARADLGAGGYAAFGSNLLRYLEPIATMQAFHPDFHFTYVERDISGEDLDWFSVSFFRHWDQAFHLLNSRHPSAAVDDVRHIITAFVRLGVNIVDVFHKYWYQRPQDGADQDADGGFGGGCERAGQKAIERQWKVDLDSPFSQFGVEPCPLHIRTILARADHVRARKTFFNTVAFLCETTAREDLQGELFQMLLRSVKDWAAVTGGGNAIASLVDAMVHAQRPLAPVFEAVVDAEWPWASNNAPHNPSNFRPLNLPPVILYYDLPDELPDPTEEDVESLDSFPGEEVQEEDFDVRWGQPGPILRLLNRLNPFHDPNGAPLEFRDVPLEPYGPRIDPRTVSQECELSQDETCAICLDDFAQQDAVQKSPETGQRSYKVTKDRLSRWKRRITGMAVRKNAKNKTDMRAMKLNLCDHILHFSCLEQLLNQAYPETGRVRCPYCRTDICAARPFRAVRGRFGRLRERLRQFGR